MRSIARRSTAALIAIVFAIGLLPASFATHATWSEEEFVEVSAFGMTLADPCDPDDPANGVTTTVYEIPGGFADGDHDFVLDPAPTLDVDPYFHQLDEGECKQLGYGPVFGFLGETEEGTIPAGATHIEIVHWAGAGNFTLTVE